MLPLRIAITGTESTGKSTLAEALAEHYQTVFVPEYARQYIDKIQRPYTLADIEIIARQQMAIEDNMATQTSSHLFFCDTDLLVSKIWAEHAFQTCPIWITQQLQQRPPYALYLLLDIDLPWQPDPQREHPHLRQYLFEWYQKELVALQANWVVISGIGEQRLDNAIRAINTILSQ